MVVVGSCCCHCHPCLCSNLLLSLRFDADEDKDDDAVQIAGIAAVALAAVHATIVVAAVRRHPCCY